MSILALMYKKVFKPLAFFQDPEVVHDRILILGKFLGRHKIFRIFISKILMFEHSMLKQTILGIEFLNPIGLAAGFDKNAELIQILPAVGFGFAELGSITGEECKGNDKPRLWRLLKSQSLVVHYGLKNDGCKAVSQKLKNQHSDMPLGINIAKTNNRETVSTEAGIADYVKAYKAFKNIGSYTTINISCPNAFGGQPFTDAVNLEMLLSQIDYVPSQKPVFVKLSPDLNFVEIDTILQVLDRHKIAGIICANLTKNRDNHRIKDSNLPSQGGLSGKVVEELSNNLIAYIYKKTRGKYIIIGCGGVFNASDAYKKIRLGASLVQLITGMIFEGPQVIGEINRGLVKLLHMDGFENISQAIGTDTVDLFE